MNIILIVLVLLGYQSAPIVEVSYANNLETYVDRLKVVNAYAMQDSGMGVVVDDTGCVYALSAEGIVVQCISIGGYIDDQGNTVIIGALSYNLIPLDEMIIESMVIMFTKGAK